MNEPKISLNEEIEYIKTILLKMKYYIDEKDILPNFFENENIKNNEDIETLSIIWNKFSSINPDFMYSYQARFLLQEQCKLLLQLEIFYFNDEFNNDGLIDLYNKILENSSNIIKSIQEFFEKDNLSEKEYLSEF
jgi:hypothetical protein